ncbi:anti-sigma factor [Pedobacter sp. HMWF019]|uniref:FecR family protein n=1 Tax=Pedobacter sp. HMWF019 TaxID=2056856 RepID=UPI000D368229|nr:FecR family protein [Pedobacter sp. HMWF019]PTT02282.1 anti-sigma factor [Pedobacter sp. HMWF019]
MQQDPKLLLKKYMDGECSEEEKAIVESWYQELNNINAHHSLNNHPNKDLVEQTKKEVWNTLSVHKNKNKGTFLWLKITSAAVVLILLSVYLFLPDQKSTLTRQVAKISDIAPGGNKAFLTLANGKKISLTDAANGELVKEAGLVIQKKADGQLIYTAGNSAGSASGSQYNIIETPRGGKYQINLPDGTRVWLNSGSALKYPLNFTGHFRKVELKGEGYFEVAKDKTKPFLVKTTQQEVEVLGTHFNISSYTDEAVVKTTLLEGSVKVKATLVDSKVSSQEILKPGQQSQLRSNQLKIGPADLESVMAWKNGDFVFEGDDLKSIMRQLSRWYDVEVIYQGNFENLHFGGYVSRSKNISSVLNIMASTGKVHFKISDKKIIVTNNK